MLPRPNFWLKWMLPGVLAVLVALSAWSWWVQPETTLVGFARIPSGAQASFVLGEPAGAEPCFAWRLQLHLDASLKPPGPEWMLFEGNKPGEGYELHWLPAKLGLHLFRATDQLLLGCASLERFPEQVVLARRGYRLEVWVDDRLIIECLDPQPPPPIPAWGIQSAGAMDDSTLSLHDDRRLLDPALVKGLLIGHKEELKPLLSDRERPDHALLCVRYALDLDPEKSAAEMVTALENAGAAVRALAARDHDRAELQHWLAWGELHFALARQDLDAPERTSAAVEQLAALGEQDPVSESPGLLMETLDRIARVCARPPYRAPAEVMRWRRAWLQILAFTATRSESACPPAIMDAWRWQLRLLIHAAECLGGQPPLVTPGAAGVATSARSPWPRPTPVEAPDWVVSRWRAFAGGDPGAPAFASSIPSIPDERNPIRPALERIIQLAAFEPGGVAAVMMRARILDALDAPLPANASADALKEAKRAIYQKAVEAIRSNSAPAREAALAMTLLAIRDLADGNPVLDASAALNDLDPDPKHQSLGTDGVAPLARHDALAYALYRLLQHRLADAKAGPPGGNPLGKPEDIPDSLAPYSRLLSGKAEATHEAWLSDPAVLPPVQALAAALAMQEVAGIRPAWELLDGIPCFTVPVRLMRPRGENPAGTTPGQNPVKPPVVP